MSFLPDNYETPQQSSSYLKFQDGENKLRILSKPVIGWLDWKDNKPMRFRMNAKPEKPVDPLKPIRHFWAMLVWSYQNNAIMILEITQATIQKSIESLSKDDDWGAPFAYDLKIVKKGKEKQTEYSVTPSPKKKPDDSILKAALEKPGYLEALYDGADPWAVSDKYKQTIVEPLDLPF